MKYLFILNPVSGKGDARTTVAPVIRAWFADKELDWEIVETQYPQHAKELAFEAAQSGEPLRICACGGDGTLSEVVCGVFGCDHVEVAHYPCGSGNDFVKCYGDMGAFRSVEAVVGGVAQPVDLLRVNDRLCMNLISVGIDADVAHGMNSWRKYKFLSGPMCYNLALVGCLFKPLGKQMRLTVGDEVLEGCFTLAAAGNGKVYGGGYMATPDALVDDGVIDVVAVDKIPLLRIARVLGIYKKGQHYQNGEVVEELRDCLRYFKTDRLKIESPKDFFLNIDGEIVRTNSASVEMLHHSLRFVVPPVYAKRAQCGAAEKR